MRGSALPGKMSIVVAIASNAIVVTAAAVNFQIIEKASRSTSSDDIVFRGSGSFFQNNGAQEKLCT